MLTLSRRLNAGVLALGVLIALGAFQALGNGALAQQSDGTLAPGAVLGQPAPQGGGAAGDASGGEVPQGAVSKDLPKYDTVAYCKTFATGRDGTFNADREEFCLNFQAQSKAALTDSWPLLSDNTRAQCEKFVIRDGRLSYVLLRECVRQFLNASGEKL